MAIGIFDLDGFKAYNDTFGHPAGDALLHRLGGRLAAVVGDRGGAYRIGGDEFVVVTNAPDTERVLSAAETALSEHTNTFAIGCSRGAARIVAGVTFEDALRVADQRLYTNKRSGRTELRSEARDALLQVLDEQGGDLTTHLGQVAELAERLAIGLGLSPELVERTRIAAELHDVGKAAILAAILEKPGPLDAAERSLMERHSAIGARIVAAAPTLERDRADRPSGARATGRLRVPGRAPVGGDPDLGPHHRGGRRVRRDDERSSVPAGDGGRRRDRGAAPECGHAVRAPRRRRAGGCRRDPGRGAAGRLAA